MVFVWNMKDVIGLLILGSIVTFFAGWYIYECIKYWWRNRK